MKERSNKEQNPLIQQPLFELDEDGNIIVPWAVETSRSPFYTPKEIEDLFAPDDSCDIDWVTKKWG